MNSAMVNPSMNIPKDDSEEEFMINPIFKIINIIFNPIIKQTYILQ